MMAAKIDSSGAAAASADKNDEVITRPEEALDDAGIESLYAESLIEAAETMIDDLVERYGVEFWIKQRLAHIKNVLILAQAHTTRSVRIVEETEALLMQPRGQA